MALPNLMQIGNSGMILAKAGISTAGHNITNANTPGFSRQKIVSQSNIVTDPSTRLQLGHGSQLSKVERLNDTYLENQLRNSFKEISHFEEKNISLKQLEDVFNEMSGDGLNRMIGNFFNQFRALASQPESEILRESLRESTLSMISDFHRLNREVLEVQAHLDMKIEGYLEEVNGDAQALMKINEQILKLESTKSGDPNDLLDRRDLILKTLGFFF